MGKTKWIIISNLKIQINKFKEEEISMDYKIKHDRWWKIILVKYFLKWVNLGMAKNIKAI